MLRVFGCMCMALVPKHLRHNKLGAKAIWAVHLGMAQNSKGWLLWDPFTKKFLVSRDCKFMENLMYKDWKAENEAKIGMRFGEVKSSGLEHVELPMELSSGSTTTRQSSLVNGGEEAKDAEEEEEEVQQQRQGLHVPAAEEEGRGKRRIQAPIRLTYDALGRPAKSALAGAAVLVGDDKESDYEDCAFAFFSPVEMPGEPATLKEALESSDAEEWKKAMESELKSIEENGTWELVELPEGRKAITSKWLFKIKSDADGNIERYKSRLVAKGYQQKEKVDYKELFAPVVKPTTLRTLLAGAAIKGWVVKQMDVTTAFLNGVLEEEIFMAQPEGFDDGSGRVLRLKKALYGLKQAPRQWYLKLRGVLEEIGFTPSSADHSFFMLGEGEQRSFMVVYVDDILIFSPSSDLVKEVMLKLQDKFKCKALGDVSFYLGLHIERDVEKRCMWVHKRKYLEALAANFGQSEGHVATPFPSGFKCMKGPEEERVGEEERRRFHSLVGSLMYAAVNTRPDAAFATGQSGVSIFDLDYDAIFSAMYALSASAKGDCYWCVPPDPGITATALGASESSTLPGTTPAQAHHTFTLDSSASRCFFRDSTTLTPLPALVPVRQADPSGGPVVACSSTVLPCLGVLSDSLSGLHLPSFSTNSFTTTAPGCQRVLISTCTRTGRHLAMFTHRPGSSLYTLATEPPQVAASAQVSASGQTLHMDVCGPACVSGHGRERYFLLVVDNYMRYTTVFPLCSKGEVVDVLIPWIRTGRLQLRERFRHDLPVLRLHSNRGGGFSSDLLRDFCRGEGILQSFTLSASPQQNGIAEHRIGLVMEVARTSMIHAAAPHFRWPFAVRYAAHQLNLRPRVSLPETSPTLRWTGKVGDASLFRVWGSRAFVRDTSTDKLSARAIPCVFLGFVPDAPGWQFYQPTSCRVLPSQDVTFDKSLPFYCLFPYRSAPPPPPPLFLAPDPLPSIEPVEVAIGSGAAQGAASGGAASGGAELGGAESEGPGSRGAEPRGEEPGDVEPAGVEPGGAEPEGVERQGAESEGAESGGAEPRGAASSGGAGDAGDGGVGVTARARCTGGTAAAGPGGARTRGVGSAGAGGVGGAGAGDPTELGAAGVGGSWAGGAGAGGARAGRAGQVLGVPPSTSLSPPLLCPPPDQSQTSSLSASPLPAPSPYTEQYGGLIERPEPASLPVSPVRTTRRVPHLHPPPVPGTHAMALRPSSVPLRVPLPAPPESSLPEVPDPASDRARSASPTVSRLLATALSDTSFDSAAASALVAELLDFAAACRLDYATALVVESAFANPPFVGDECALGTDVLEDRQEDFECLAAAVPRFSSMLLAPEGDPDAPDILTPPFYAEAITGPYSSQWQAAMDAEMASWKSIGTYVDEVPPPGANIVDGMWIFRVKRPLCSL
ncbi:unnamed protein product [Closterium sp. NIES-53]